MCRTGGCLLCRTLSGQMLSSLPWRACSYRSWLRANVRGPLLARNPVAHMSPHCLTTGRLHNSVDTGVGRVARQVHAQEEAECPSLAMLGGKRTRSELAFVVLLAPCREAVLNGRTWSRTLPMTYPRWLPRCCNCSAPSGRGALFVVLMLGGTDFRTLAIPLVRLSNSLAFAIESGPLLETASVRAWHAVPRTGVASVRSPVQERECER